MSVLQKPLPLLSRARKDRTLKILLVGPVYPYRGGIAHYTARLAQEIGRQHQVSVLSFRRQFPRWLYPGQSDRDPSQERLAVQAEYLLEPLNPLSWWRSARRIQVENPDLVLLQWWVTFWSPAYTMVTSLCRRRKIPVAYLIHNVLPHEGGPLHRPLARLALSRGQRFIVHTQEEQRRLEQLLPGASSLVCPFPVYDMLASQDSISKEAARRRMSLPAQARLLLFFGIVRPYKGLQVLLDALARLNQQNERYHLLVAGEFWHDKAAYLAQIERQQLAELVHIEDRYIPNEELSLCFAAADVAVAPYTGGTQSAVAALALGFGIPLITTDRSAAGLSEADRHEVVVVPPGDAPALAEAIQSIFKNLPDRTPTGARPEAGGWGRIVAAIEEITRSVKDPHA